MGKLKHFDIEIAGEKSFYFAGDIITGNVELDLKQPMEMLRLMLVLQGKGKCTTGSKCIEEILNDSITLFGSTPKTHGKNLTHPSGKHSYPFNFTLPESLPSSASEPNGSIKYKLIAQIAYKGITGAVSKSWKVANVLEIKERIDANLPEDRMQPIMQLRKTGGIFSNAKKLEKHDLLVSTDRGVYCSKEKIKVLVQYKDGVARKMGSVKVKFNKYVLYNPRENKRTNSTRKIIKEVSDTRHRTDKIHDLTLEIDIPEKISPTNILSNAVVINYIIHLKVDGYPEMKIPVIIGTIAYNESQVFERIRGDDDLIIENPEENPHFNSSPSDQQSFNMSAPPYTDAINTSAPPYTDVIKSDVPTGAPYSNHIQTSSIYPDLYIPENEFDLPPSYEESTATAPPSE